jgi:hypothetical protein
MVRLRLSSLPVGAVIGIAATIAACAMSPSSAGRTPDDGFVLSFAAGSRDAAGRFMGGTELRNFTAYQGKLYAGNGYWEDRPGAEGWQGAQILVLDGPDATWRVEHVFDDTMPSRRKRDFAISALQGVTFATDGSGAALPRPVSMLLASSWDLSGATRIFSRDDDDGGWTATLLAADRPAPDFLPQIRSLAQHRDRSTGIDLVFVGNDPRGVFAGTYDPTVSGRIRWGAVPELDISAIPTAGFRGLEGRLRVSSFAECNGLLYAAIGQQIYERGDGATPRWRLVYTNPRPGHSETGLRGLTAIANPAGGAPGGGKEALLAAVEGDAARIVRVDPGDGAETTELDLVAFLGREWGTRIGYVIAAYNDMTRFGDVLLLGVQAFIPRRLPAPLGHALVDVGYGQVEAGAWYLVRHSDGTYDLHEIVLPAPDRSRALVTPRVIAVSPFPGHGDEFYFGGFDTNKAPVHNTAWIARARAATVLGR